MWLIGNVNVENESRDSTGIVGEVRVPFILPRKLKRRRGVKIRYMAFHSGAMKDIITLNAYDANTVDERADLGWRSACREVRVKIVADGANIMHDNAMVKHVKYVDGVEMNSVQTIDYITYPATMASEAMSHTGGVLAQNDTSRPLSVHRSHNQLEDILVGHIDPNVSKLEVVFTAEHQTSNSAPSDRYSHEPNVRMDTISIVLELV